MNMRTADQKRMKKQRKKYTQFRWNYCRIYMVIQIQMLIFWEVTVTTPLKNINGYRHKAVWIYKHKSIVKGNKERKITVNFIFILI
jgi:hypothetical protein